MVTSRDEPLTKNQPKSEMESEFRISKEIAKGRIFRPAVFRPSEIARKMAPIFYTKETKVTKA